MTLKETRERRVQQGINEIPPIGQFDSPRKRLLLLLLLLRLSSWIWNIVIIGKRRDKHNIANQKNDKASFALISLNETLQRGRMRTVTLVEVSPYHQLEHLRPFHRLDSLRPLGFTCLLPDDIPPHTANPVDIQKIALRPFFDQSVNES